MERKNLRQPSSMQKEAIELAGSSCFALCRDSCRRNTTLLGLLDNLLQGMPPGLSWQLAPLLPPYWLQFLLIFWRCSSYFLEVRYFSFCSWKAASIAGYHLKV